MDLRKLLAAVEEVPPIAAVDALAAELAQMVDASHVSLLIANFSGNAVVRLSHVTSEGPLDNGHNERGESLSLTGSSTSASCSRRASKSPKSRTIGSCCYR